MIKLMGMGFIFMLMEPNMKECGKKISKTDRGEKAGRMELAMKGNIKMGKN